MRFELAGFDAVVKGCPADAKDMGSFAAYGYREGKVDKGEAYIVQEIFGRLADGASCRTIAAELNARRIPSPGSTWSRTVLRASGWMGLACASFLHNERYRGVVQWNTSEWRKDPDTGKRRRVMRPRAE